MSGLSTFVAGYRGARSAMDANERKAERAEDRDWQREQRDVQRKSTAAGLEVQNFALEEARTKADDRKRREAYQRELTQEMIPPTEGEPTPGVFKPDGGAAAPSGLDAAPAPAGPSGTPKSADAPEVVRAPGKGKAIQAGTASYFERAYALATKHGLRDEMDKASVGMADMSRKRFEGVAQKAGMALEMGDAGPLVNLYNNAFPDGKRIVKHGPIGPDGMMEVESDDGSKGRVNPVAALANMLDPKKWVEMSAKRLEAVTKGEQDRKTDDHKTKNDKDLEGVKGGEARKTEGAKTAGRIAVEKEKGTQDRKTDLEKPEKAAKSTASKDGLDAARLVKQHLSTDSMGGMTGENAELIDDAAAEAERLARDGTPPAEAAKQGIEKARRERETRKATTTKGSPKGGGAPTFTPWR